jgi:Plasmid pRiA4b ORF-3-like protein
VSLVGAEPKVWRQFLIHKYSTLGDLHKAIQVACGWQDYHLYSFSHKNPADRFGPDDSVFAVSPHDEVENYDPEPKYADKLRLTWIFDDHSIGLEIFYLYDYGDGWIHSVKMVGFQKLDEKFRRKLVAGARAFPIEDSGALPGYQRCVDF